MNTAAHPVKGTRFSRIGIAAMLLGAILVVAGIVQTTTSDLGGNQSCPSGTVLIAKFNYDHGYDFEKPAGNEHVVTLSDTSASGGTWHSTLAVSAVIVKGGPDAVLTTIAPPQYDGEFSNAGLPKVGEDEKNLPDISNVQFCGPANEPTTTTTGPSTSTSTTVPATTSTSTPPVTTTYPGETTTTTTAATTTTSTSTTTSTTTRPNPTVTTEPPATTTFPGETTTTTAPETTTSFDRSGTTIVGSTSTTEHGQGSTVPIVTSTTVLTPGNTGNLPFTGGQSVPLLIFGILFLAGGSALTFSASRRGRGRA